MRVSGKFVLRLLSEAFWQVPFRFGVANCLGPTYSLRCVLFHDITDEESALTAGLGSAMCRQQFEDRIRFLAAHYSPISLSTFLDHPQRKYARPPVLVTFDDAYASFAQAAAPILIRHGVPAIFFVNGACLGNSGLLMGNLLCYLINTQGIELVRYAAREVTGRDDMALNSLAQILSEFLPSLSQDVLADFRASLISTAAIRLDDLAHRAQLYISAEQLRALVRSGFEIGNHTLSHVFCRSLRGDELTREIGSNKVLLENLAQTRVRAFAVPYGRKVDITEELIDHLRATDHEAVFLVESRCNTPVTDRFHLNRVSVHAATDADFFTELEILPRLRSLRDQVFGTRTGRN